jgi:formate-dependent nitrite reductase membrane component NrfD
MPRYREELGRSLLESFWSQLLIGLLLVALVAPQLFSIVQQAAYASRSSDLLMSAIIALLGLFLISRALLSRFRPAKNSSQD